MATACVVGGGVFGITGALELNRRGWSVTLVDPGPLPHPEAASTDISKVVRSDYGEDTFYTHLMERALPRWAAWNEAHGEPLFHQPGFLLLTQGEMAPGSFERSSFIEQQRRGVPVVRVRDPGPPWRPGAFTDGYLNPTSGWADSAAVVAWLVKQALDAGVTWRRGAARQVRSGHVYGDGWTLRADRVVVAAGAATPQLLPQLASKMRAVGQPVFHLAPADPTPFRGPGFPPWAGDISRTGWYGFPATASGIVKVAHHGDGVPVPDVWNRPSFPPEAEAACRAFLRTTLPELALAPLRSHRLCLYCDSVDGDFWIDALPDDPATIVAAGGSGHGFKFAPVLGELIADAVEDRDSPWRSRFAWRDSAGHRHESARAVGSPSTESPSS